MANSGKYRNRIIIEKPILPPNAGEIGAPPTQWVQHAVILASVVSYNSREYEAAKALRSDMALLLETRPRADITEKMRIVFKGNISEIDGVWDPDGTNQRMFVSCREKKVNKGGQEHKP